MCDHLRARRSLQFDTLIVAQHDPNRRLVGSHFGGIRSTLDHRHKPTDQVLDPIQLSSLRTLITNLWGAVLRTAFIAR
jgi:hypothetical protein